MEHFYEREYSHSVPLVFAECGPVGNRPNSRDLQAGVNYRKTRSTLALDAIDFFDLENDQAIATFSSLIRLCKLFGREEIVIECLEILPLNGKELSVKDCVNAVQSGVTKACRKMNLYPPRVSLEKRGDHFDLRIYPTFH